MDWAGALAVEGVLKTPRIIEAFRAIRREHFVPDELREDAAAVNAPLPIGQGQTISQPWTVAFMLELLQPAQGQRILDIGAGSGWQTALLAHIVSGGMFRRASATEPKPKPNNPVAAARRRAKEDMRREKEKGEGKVYAIERILELCAFGEANVEKYNFIAKGIVEWFCRDATEGLPERAPFDRIVAAAELREIPAAWKEQCVIGGIIVAPLSGSVWRLVKKAEDAWEREEYPGFAFVPFISGERRGG